MTPTWSIETPRAGPGAIALIRIRGEGTDACVGRLGLTPLEVGRAGLRSIAGVDEGVAIRWAENELDLMPHGGPAVLRRLAAELTARGLSERGQAPDAGPIDARGLEEAMLGALAHAASPLAVDLLLDQPRRWAGHDPADRAIETADHASLRHLLGPPIVTAVGAANIGKSTLMNSLAGRGVALVADEPGVTRDHVGVTLDLDGLVVRYLDTPGVLPDTADPIAKDSIRIALDAARSADLVLLCGDPGTEPPDPADLGLGGVSVTRVCLRADRGEPAWAPEIRVSAHTGSGVDELARHLRLALVPDRAILDPRPWRFWAS